MKTSKRKVLNADFPESWKDEAHHATVSICGVNIRLGDIIYVEETDDLMQDGYGLVMVVETTTATLKLHANALKHVKKFWANFNL